jgi:plastocyanin
MRKKVGVIVLVLALSLFSFGMVNADEAGTTWEVAVGKQLDGISVDSMFPKVTYIHVGDTVTFTNGAEFAPHTVTFLAGAAPLNPADPSSLAPTAPSGVAWDGKSLQNSGMLLPGMSYTMTFTEAGAYSFYCALHPLMQGTVVVIPKGQPIPSAVEQAATAHAQLADLTAQAHALHEAAQPYQAAKNEDGTLTYQVEAGTGFHGFTINRMIPETLFISEGDSVEWLNDNHYEMHFITFNKPDDMQFFGEHGEFNFAFMAPAGGPLFDGTGFTNSGVMMAGKSYKLTFTKAGTYTYECYLHSGDKMVGTIVVAPKDTIKVIVNGTPLVYDFKLPHLHNNHVYAAVVPFAEALGGKAVWNDKLSAVVVNIGGEYALPQTLQNAPGVKIVINGKQLVYGFEPAPHLHDGRSYASVQEMVSLLGGSYSWDERTKTFSVEIDNGTAAESMASQHAH